jgi:hypothetical protein
MKDDLIQNVPPNRSFTYGPRLVWNPAPITHDTKVVVGVKASASQDATVSCTVEYTYGKSAKSWDDFGTIKLGPAISSAPKDLTFSRIYREYDGKEPNWDLTGNVKLTYKNATSSVNRIEQKGPITLTLT